MVFVHRRANWDAQNGASADQDGDKPRKHGAGGRSDHFAKHLARVDRSTLRRVLSSENSVATSTVEIAGAHSVTVIAVTVDPELRAALTNVLPRNGVVFAESPEQVLGRPVPIDCGVLIVEHTVSRQAFEQLKSYLKASAPALVNIMVGTHNDGSSLIGLLSSGWIDRFMVKPFETGPTRIALRSALQQHRSLRTLVQVDRSSPDMLATASAPSAATQIPAVRSDMPKRSAISPQPLMHPNARDVAEPLACDSDEDSESDLKKSNTDAAASSRPLSQPSARTGIGSATGFHAQAARVDRQLMPSSPASNWTLAFALLIAVASLIAWGLSSRSTDVAVNKALVNKVVAGHLAAAQRAFELGTYVDPPELSAIHFYNAALELDPLSEQARLGLAAVVDRLITDSKHFIDTGDLLRAQSTLDTVRRLQPNHRELTDVTASLLSAREAERRTIQAAYAVANPTIEPIIVAASSGATALPRKASAPPGAKSSASIEPKVANTPQRQEGFLQTESRATQTNKELPVSAQDSTLKRADEIKTGQGKIEPAQAQSELHAAAKVAAVRDIAMVDAAISSTASSPTALSATTPIPAVSPAAPVSLASKDSGPDDVSTKVTVSDPTLIRYVPPVYPITGRVQEVEGWVDVHFLVTSDGSVINPRIKNGTLGANFHRAALAAVSKWKFSPASNGARPNHPMNIVLEFKLTD